MNHDVFSVDLLASLYEAVQQRAQAQLARMRTDQRELLEVHPVSAIPSAASIRAEIDRARRRDAQEQLLTAQLKGAEMGLDVQSSLGSYILRTAMQGSWTLEAFMNDHPDGWGDRLIFLEDFATHALLLDKKPSLEFELLKAKRNALYAELVPALEAAGYLCCSYENSPFLTISLPDAPAPTPQPSETT